MKPHGLSSRINKHSAAMEKEIRKSLEEPFNTTLMDDAVQKFQAAIVEETKNFLPGMHGCRLQLPRWPVAELKQPESSDGFN